MSLSSILAEYSYLINKNMVVFILKFVNFETYEPFYGSSVRHTQKYFYIVFTVLKFSPFQILKNILRTSN